MTTLTTRTHGVRIIIARPPFGGRGWYTVTDRVVESWWGFPRQLRYVNAGPFATIGEALTSAVVAATS